ncbi:MAG: LysR family transcriptional regulator [Verrucomicrobiaceae bacterium]|jgi:DNA-binding transcriptional LysR family regulator|nr:LysR family transcriptional regulator [Verrucomicrobiaceae bacterium]
MNVHHLELFYYVARHGGVSAAARQMPYGIQQPAISAQILQLEDTLGVTLYQRRPFQLTKEGQMLYGHIAPFFKGLDEVAERIRGGGETRLRIAAPEIVQREYLPELCARMRRRVKGFHFTLTEARQHQIEALLAAQEIDIGLSTLTEKPPPNVETREITRLPMCLLVPSQSGITKAAQILEADRIDLPLITLGAVDPLVREFHAALRQRGVEWITSLEVGSLDTVARYVAGGFGAGLSLQMPRVEPPPGVKVLPLPDFSTLAFGAIWIGRLTPLGEMFLEESRAMAGELDS